MKKVMKSFMAMALGLSLVLTGCSKDEDDAFEGNYEVVATVTGAPEDVSPISTTLHLTKDGANYRAAAELSTFGSLSLLLTSVTEVVNVGGAQGYSFVVAPQTLTVNIPSGDSFTPTPLPVSGIGALSSAADQYAITMSLTVTLPVSEDVTMPITVTITGTK